MFDPYRKRRERAASIRASRMGAVDFGVPVDGDVPAWRSQTARAGDLVDAIVADLVRDRSPFYDEVCVRWRSLFPELSAKPGKWVSTDVAAGGGKLFLHVKSAAGSFALRPRLPAIRKRLAQLDSAPKRFSVHVEIVR